MFQPLVGAEFGETIPLGAIEHLISNMLQTAYILIIAEGEEKYAKFRGKTKMSLNHGKRCFE